MVIVYEQSDKTVPLWKEFFWKGARKKATLKQINVSHRPVLSEKRAAGEKKATATLLKSTSIYKLRETSFWGINYLYDSIQTVEFHICTLTACQPLFAWGVLVDNDGCYKKDIWMWVMFPHFILSDWFEKLCSTCRTGSCTHMTFCKVQSQLILWGHI